MAIKHAGAKALRQSTKARRRNIEEKGKVAKLLKSFRKAVEAKKWDDAKTALRAAGKALDKAVAHGVMTKNTTARLKSRAARALNTATKAK